MYYERCTLDDVASALRFIPAGEREIWVRMGMAVKSEFGSDGFDVWNDWSKSADNYNNKAARDSWKSFKQGGGVSIASLFKEAISEGWKPTHSPLSDEQRLQMDRDREARKVKREKEQALEADEQAAWYASVAQASLQVWGMLKPLGNSPYIARKKIQPCGVGFVPHGIVIEFIEDDQRVDVITGRDKISAFFARKTEDSVFRYLKPGCLVVPLYDVNATLKNLQIIYSTGKKSFLKYGPKSGLYFQIGVIEPDSIIVFVEGYATGASVHMATGYPVIVCLDAGNLPVVARELRCVFSSNLFVIAGDDDPDSPGNPGLTKATEAANDVAGIAVLPVFDGVANG